MHFSVYSVPNMPLWIVLPEQIQAWTTSLILLISWIYDPHINATSNISWSVILYVIVLAHLSAIVSKEDTMWTGEKTCSNVYLKILDQDDAAKTVISFLLDWREEVMMPLLLLLCLLVLG